MRVQLARTKDESGGPGLKLHQTRSGLRGLLLRVARGVAAQLFGKASGLYADCDLAQVDQKSAHGHSGVDPAGTGPTTCSLESVRKASQATRRCRSVEQRRRQLRCASTSADGHARIGTFYAWKLSASRTRCTAIVISISYTY